MGVHGCEGRVGGNFWDMGGLDSLHGNNSEKNANNLGKIGKKSG